MVNVHEEYLVSYFKELSFVIFMLLLSGNTGVGMESIKIVLSYRYADSFLYPPIGKQYFFFQEFLSITSDTMLRNNCFVS